MLENLLQLVTQNAGDAIVNNNQIPNEHNDTAIQAATDAIHQGLASQLSAGNLGGIMQMFSGGGNASSMLSNPIAQGIITNLATSLEAKCGIQGSAATGIANSLIPTVLSHLTSQTANPSNSNFDMNGIINSLTGGQQQQQQQQAGGGFDFNSLLSQVQQGGGASEIANIASQFMGGQQGGAGGIGGLISNFLK